MNPVAKESEGRKKYNNDKDVKRYLPSSAFSKTVKSSTTKSLLKFRERKEQQNFKKAQQYKSYQRVMKREGYHTNNNNNKNENTSNIGNRKRHRDDTTSNEIRNDEADSKVIIDNDKSIIKNYANTGVNKFMSEHSHDSPNHQIIHESCEQKSTRVSRNKPEGIEANANGTKHAPLFSSSDLQGKPKQSEKWNKKHNQRQEEQHRADEYKQRQIQMEREKKGKLKQRQERQKLLSARTSKGQPIMKNIALDILNKLQREQQQQQQQQPEVFTLKHR